MPLEHQADHERSYRRLCAVRTEWLVLAETIDDGDTEPPLWRAHDIALLKNARDAKGYNFKVMRAADDIGKAIRRAPPPAISTHTLPIVR